METQKLLFFGSPGAGKGTQAEKLIPNGFLHISTGDLIRKAFQENDELILPHKEAVDNGAFLPDELIFQLVEKAVLDKPNYILDGAVRTIPQAEYALEKNLVDKVIFFTLTQEQAEKRLLNRNQGRADDNPESIKKRFEIYQQETFPIIEFLKNKGIEIIEIDASGAIDEINEEVHKRLGLN